MARPRLRTPPRHWELRGSAPPGCSHPPAAARRGRRGWRGVGDGSLSSRSVSFYFRDLAAIFRPRPGLFHHGRQLVQKLIDQLLSLMSEGRVSEKAAKMPYPARLRTVRAGLSERTSFAPKLAGLALSSAPGASCLGSHRLLVTTRAGCLAEQSPVRWRAERSHRRSGNRHREDLAYLIRVDPQRV